MSQLALLFKDAEKGVIGKRPERWVTVLEARPDDDLGEVRFKIRYVTEEKRRNIAELYSGKKDIAEAFDSSAKVRTAFMEEAIVEVDGIDKRNFSRLGEFFLLSGVAETLDASGMFPFVLPADERDRDAFYSNLRRDLQLVIYFQNANLDAWATAAKAELGNASAPVQSST